MTVKIAFTGTGFAKVHARAAKAAGAQLVAVVNHRYESAAAFAAEFQIPHIYQTIDELIKAGGVDAVVVSTPNYLHAPESIAALNAGLAVLVEKPMAMTAPEAEAMVEASQRTGALLQVGHKWRFDPEVQWLREQNLSGKLGRIVRTKGYAVHVNWGPSGWFAQKALARGGAMADMGVHAIDTARYLLGDPQPVSVHAQIGTYYKDIDVDDTAIMTIAWDNGATSYLEAGWWQPYCTRPESGAELYGTLGFGELFPTCLSFPNNAPVNPGFTYPRPRNADEPMHTGQIAHFIQCIEQGKPPTPSGLIGWSNMKVVDAAYESARTGEVVEIK